MINVAAPHPPVEELRLHEQPVTVRMPFPFGVVIMTATLGSPMSSATPITEPAAWQRRRRLRKKPSRARPDVYDLWDRTAMLRIRDDAIQIKNLDVVECASVTEPLRSAMSEMRAPSITAELTDRRS